MRTGPPNKPTALRVLQGNASKRPLNEHEAKPELLPEQIEPPIKLSEKALSIWQEMTPILSKLGLLTSCDVRVLARYCDIFVRWVRARDYLDENGETYPVYDYYRDYDKTARVWETKKRLKGMANFPQVGNYLNYGKELVRLEGELGLTPSARSRIQVEVFGKVGKDPLADYLASNTRKRNLARQ